MTGRPHVPRVAPALRQALAALTIWLTASAALAQAWNPSDEGVNREELAPPVAYEERGRGVIREELDPVMAADGSGLPHELWNGLSAEQFAQAITALELPPRSPALHVLWRRLIGSDTVPATGADGARFTALRVEALNQSGLIDEAAAVLARDPAADSDPLLLALTAASEIGLGNMERGCEIGRGLLSRGSELPKPIQADIILINGICSAARGDTAAAAIQAGLMRELDLGGAGADLLDAVAGGLKPEIPAGTKLSLIDYRIIALGGEPDRTKLVTAASPALLAGLAHDPRVAPDLRLAAGEAAVKLNAIPAEDLAPLYRAEGAGGDVGTIERAGLFKSAEREQTPLKKTRLIRAFLDEARRAGLYWQALQLMAGPTQALEPVPEIGWFAETGVEVNLASGDYEAARRWAAFIDAPYTANRPSDPLAHWIALADIADPAVTSGFGRSLGAVEGLALNGRFDPAVLHRLVTVLDALNIDVPMTLWDLAGRSPQPAGGHLPDTGVLSELAEASQKKHFGRTVLLVMRTIGPQGADGAHMIALGDSLRALNRAGLAPDARRLALEALLPAWPRTVSQ
ncbi:hypothetical protein [Hyphomicrobium sp.]|uniref:hypothetical protein n=1 Tax=Hyphomicrobium sp. TaxID=82 RepID=UPI0025BF86A4|nr:hypothetical protein [Hyphomicrobium sp.]MCC7251152.1 hypothetical protein [Hyphomicrobium sp.]